MAVMTVQPPLPLVPEDARAVGAAAAIVEDEDGGRVFVHGNLSTGRFFEQALAALPAGCRGIAPDLRGFGDTDPEPVDATRGLGDYADDLAAVIEALALGDRVSWGVAVSVALILSGILVTLRAQARR